MKTQIKSLLVLFLVLPAYPSHADVGFTQQDLELVKSACLAGSSFEFTTEADGSISVKNLEGKGKLHVTKRSVDTVDLPDLDKKQEFNDIRACIKDYLMRKVTRVTVRGTSRSFVRSKYASIVEMEKDGCSDAVADAHNSEASACAGIKAIEAMSACSSKHNGGTYTFQVAITFSCTYN